MTKETNPVQQFSTRRISIFLNGVAFFQKTAELDASTAQVKFDKLPIGDSAQWDQSQGYQKMKDATLVLFGSVWFSSPANPLLRMSVFNEEVQTEVASTTLTEMLSQNLGKTIQFTLKNDPSPYSGKIVSLTDGVLLIKMDKGWKQLGLEAIDHLDFEGNPDLFRKNVIQKRILQLDFERQQKSVPVDLVYFQKGITWLPTYHLQLLGENRAKLSLKANLLNEIEDLHEVTLNFVLGIPSFSYVKEPLFSGQSLDDFMRAMRSSQSTSSYYSTRNAMEVERVRASYNIPQGENDVGNDPDAAGELSNEDLFAFTRENLSLPKGGRMLIHLLETDISYEDNYTVLLKKQPSRGNMTNTVWHSLKFKNTSGLPLPTGTIAFVKDENGLQSPISQNQLDFVPAGLFAGVRMTQVPDIAVFNPEKVINSEEIAEEKAKLFTIEATIEISNFKKKAITLEIKQEIKAELLSCDHPWTTKQIGAPNKRPQNQSHEVTWVVPLQAGEHKKIMYSFKLFA